MCRLLCNGRHCRQEAVNFHRSVFFPPLDAPLTSVLFGLMLLTRVRETVKVKVKVEHLRLQQERIFGSLSSHLRIGQSGAEGELV